MTPFDGDWLEDYKLDAYEYHDSLLEMGGRPTRPVLEEPAGHAIYEKEEIRIMNEKGELQGTVALDENLLLHHWTEERACFLEELDRWKEFRVYQQASEHKPLLKMAFDPENTDQRLMKILARVNDWREFQNYQQAKADRSATLIRNITRKVVRYMRKETLADETTSSPEIQYGPGSYLHELFPRQQNLETAQNHLTWIEGQVSEILLEACASLEDAFPLQKELEKKLDQQANVLYQELAKLQARPDDPLQYPHQSADISQKILYWGSEITQLMKDHWEWETFLRWRTKQPYTETSADIKEHDLSRNSSYLEVWVDYVSYRRYQLDKTRDLVASWQRLLMRKESNIPTASLEHSLDGGLMMLESSISMVRDYVEKFQQDVHSAEHQLHQVEQQLAKLSSQQTSPNTVQVTQQSPINPQLPLSPPESEPIEISPKGREVVHLSSSPTEVCRTRGSKKPPISRIAGSVRPSAVPNKVRKTRAARNGSNRRWPVSRTDVAVPDQIIAEDDTKMTEAPDPFYPQETAAEDEGIQPTKRLPGSVEDTLMANVEVPVTTSSRPVPRIDSKGRGTRGPRKSPVPIHQVPVLRKSRCSTNLNKTIASKVHKDKGEKPAKRAKTFTEQQTMALLNATSVEGPLQDFSPLRRSQRLKDKIVALSLTLPPQSNAAQPYRSSRQRKPGKQLGSVNPLSPSTRKRRRTQSSPIEVSVSSRQKRLKT